MQYIQSNELGHTYNKVTAMVIFMIFSHFIWPIYARWKYIFADWYTLDTCTGTVIWLWSNFYKTRW